MKLEIELNEDELQLLYYAVADARTEEEKHEIYLEDLMKKSEHYKNQATEGIQNSYKAQKFYARMMRLLNKKED